MLITVANGNTISFVLSFHLRLLIPRYSEDFSDKSVDVTVADNAENFQTAAAPAALQTLRRRALISFTVRNTNSNSTSA